MKNKFLLVSLSSILIIGGWFLEVYYYQFRFVGDGTPFWISVIIGVTLTLLLSGLFTMRSVGARIGRVGLICMSVWFTWSGQNYSYNQSQNKNSIKTTSSETVQQKYNDYTVRINSLLSDIEVKDSMLPDNLKDRTWLNKNGVQPLLKEIEDLKDDLKHYESLRDNLDLSTAGIVNKSAYEMLAEDLGLSSPTPLKTASQVLLSLFIALMAPSGITILSTLNPQAGEVIKKHNTKKEKPVIETDELADFANERFRNQEKPASLKGRTDVMAALKDSGLTSHKYRKFIADEKTFNLVRSTGNMTIPNVSRSEYIMMMRNKTAYSGGLSAVRM